MAETTTEATTEATNAVRRRVRTLKIVWGFLTLQAVYMVRMSYFITSSSFDISRAWGDGSSFAIYLKVIAALCAGAAVLLPRYLLARAKAKSGPVFSAQHHGSIFRMALLLSICLYGFLASLSAHDGNSVLPFALVSLSGLLVSFPRFKNFELNDADFNKINTELKTTYPRNPWYVKLAGWLIIGLGIVDGMIGGLYVDKAIKSHVDIASLTPFGQLGWTPFLFGTILLGQNKVRREQPKMFWIAMALLGANMIPKLIQLLGAL